MNSTRLVKSGTTQIVHLTADVAFPDGVKTVTVLRDGARRLLIPTDSWDDFFDAPGIELGDRD